MTPLLALLACTPPEPSPPPPPPPVAPAPASPPAPAFSLNDCVEPLALEWKPLGDGKGGLKFAAAAVPDLDGDGRPEHFTVRQDAGSGFATLFLRLQPTNSDPIELEQVFSYNQMRHEIRIPESLHGPEKAAWRAPFEQELLRIRCATPDPSFLWLDDPAPRWVQGPPVIPPLYGIYLPDEEIWWVYSAHTHTMDPPDVGTWPVEDESRGDLHLLRTLHAVILHDEAADRHRWLWVSETGTGKLRWPTVALAGFDGDAVIIERHARGADPPPGISVDLATGAFTEIRQTAGTPPR